MEGAGSVAEVLLVVVRNFVERFFVVVGGFIKMQLRRDVLC